MSQVGGFLALFGIASIVLYFLGMHLTLLAWIDNWGEGPAWGIRIGLVVVGLLLLKVGKKKEAKGR